MPLTLTPGTPGSLTLTVKTAPLLTASTYGVATYGVATYGGGGGLAAASAGSLTLVPA